MIRAYDRKLIIEDGSQYYGYGFGADTDKVFELVFHTGVIGYQEIFSDPSYTYQGVVMTYPLIGNYGMAADDYETFHPTIGAMIVREYEDHPSNFRAEATLSEMMKSLMCRVFPALIPENLQDLFEILAAERHCLPA